MIVAVNKAITNPNIAQNIVDHIMEICSQSRSCFEGRAYYRHMEIKNPKRQTGYNNDFMGIYSAFRTAAA